MICNKVKHNNYSGAIRHINSLKKKRGGEYGAYYCAACNAYHVTSNIKSRSKFVKFKG